MKNRIIVIIVAMLMMISLCSCSVSISKQEETKSDTVASSISAISSTTALDYKNDVVGYGVTTLPDSFKSPNLNLYTEYTFGNNTVVNIYFVFLNDGYTMKDADRVEGAFRGFAYFGTMVFSTVDENISIKSLKEAFDDVSGFQELTRNNGYNLFYTLSSDDERYMNIDALSDEEKAAAEKAIPDTLELMKNVVSVEKAFPSLSFTTVDFNGNPITSEECFSQNKVTLLNCWASYCNPCEKEMPSLVQANEILAAQGCQVLLCLYNTDDRNSEEYQDAIALLERAGATNLKCIIVNDEIKQQMGEFVAGYPTSYPVGSNGQVLGTSYDGDRTPESFVDWINSYKQES